MINTHTEKPLLNNVTAVFAGGSQAFLLPQDATLEEIAVPHRSSKCAAGTEGCRRCCQICEHSSASCAPEIIHPFSRRVNARTAPASSVCPIPGP